jgi:hypothetical protein
MTTKVKKYGDIPSVDFLLLREKLGLKRYRKTVTRSTKKKKILLDIALKKIEEKEKDDFILIGYKRRKLRV